MLKAFKACYGFRVCKVWDVGLKELVGHEGVVE